MRRRRPSMRACGFGRVARPQNRAVHLRHITGDHEQARFRVAKPVHERPVDDDVERRRRHLEGSGRHADRNGGHLCALLVPQQLDDLKHLRQPQGQRGEARKGAVLVEAQGDQGFRRSVRASTASCGMVTVAGSRASKSRPASQPT